MRSRNPICSIHLNITPGSGENGKPVTGNFHYDLVSPLSLGTTGNNIVAQFVGGYSYSISPASGGINLSLSNYTSFRSLAADIGPSWPRSPLVTPYETFPAPMGTTHQTYNIFVPCP